MTMYPWLRTHYIDKVGIELKRNPLPLPLKFWDVNVPPCLTGQPCLKVEIKDSTSWEKLKGTLDTGNEGWM